LSNGFAAKSDLIEKAHKLCFSVNLARYLGQQPANIINPVSLTEICKEIAESYRLKFTVFDDKELEAIGANGILAVGKRQQHKTKDHHPGISWQRQAGSPAGAGWESNNL
jgi:leucyl aminopeptidase